MSTDELLAELRTIPPKLLAEDWAKFWRERARLVLRATKIGWEAGYEVSDEDPFWAEVVRDGRAVELKGEALDPGVALERLKDHLQRLQED